jgi:hypothetical protein
MQKKKLNFNKIKTLNGFWKAAEKAFPGIQSVSDVWVHWEDAAYLRKIVDRMALEQFPDATNHAQMVAAGMAWLNYGPAELTRKEHNKEDWVEPGYIYAREEMTKKKKRINTVRDGKNKTGKNK